MQHGADHCAHFAADWPAGHYSIATFDFRRRASGTTLTFTQADVPPKKLEAITESWKTHYWQRLGKYFAKE